MDHIKSDQVLKLIVEDFIETAEPVGSQTLLEKHGLNCSSATIRNIMVNLEKEGYIEKPHHSAGRVPSAKGYKYYLKKLREGKDTYEVDADFKKEFALVLQRKTKTVEDVMEKSCMILSEMTNLATVVMGPEAEQDNLAAIQVIPLSQRSLTAIIVTNKGYVENKTFVLEGDEEVDEIKKVVNVLNKRLVGTPIEEINEKLEALKPLISEYLGDRTNMILEAFSEAFVKFARRRLETFGASKLVELPEYANDKDELREVIELLSNPEQFNDEVDEIDDTDILLGEDRNTAIVTKNVTLDGGKTTRRLAVVGPRRMNYRKILASLDYIEKALKGYYSSYDNLEDDDE
ncbi:MAG TPA: heat-inducible transcription repressor HrcA [Firmicutes bacterium]|nr:heat-inducible transcription repressor HrcA [Bacillota bacterium]